MEWLKLFLGVQFGLTWVDCWPSCAKLTTGKCLYLCLHLLQARHLQIKRLKRSFFHSVWGSWQTWQHLTFDRMHFFCFPVWGTFSCYLLHFGAKTCISADPGLRQGRGGAWDHRRCGTCFEVAICVHGRQLQAPQPSVFKGVQGCRLPAPKCFRRPCQGNSRSYRPQPSVFKGVQGCRFVAFGSASFVCPPSCSLLLPLFEMVLQGTVCTQTNHACLGPALTQYKLSMGRLLPQCACPWQRLLCKFALGLRGRWWQTLEPMETASAQPLRATASAPVELRSAQQFHPVRPRRQPSLSRHHSFSSPTNLLHWFNLGPLQNCLFYFRNPTFSILGPATCHHPKWKLTINQHGVTRWNQIDHKGSTPDSCQSQQSFSIPTLVLNPITPSISHKRLNPTTVLTPNHRSLSPPSFSIPQSVPIPTSSGCTLPPAKRLLAGQHCLPMARQAEAHCGLHRRTTMAARLYPQHRPNVCMPRPSSTVISTCSGQRMFIAFPAQVYLYMIFHAISWW